MPFDREQIKVKAAELAAKGAFIGTSSWKYEGWLNQLYTPSRYEYRGKVASKRFERDCLSELRRARFIPNLHERKARLAAAAEEIVKEWKAQKKTLPKYALDALVPLADQKLPSIVTGLTTGATTITMLGAGMGLHYCRGGD